MKTRYYECDGGCLEIGNASFRFSIPNGFGDGKHRVRVCTKEEQDWNVLTPSKWVGLVTGDAINVYGYDCFDNLKELCENVLFTLRGEYDVYVDCGTVTFVRRNK